MRRSSVTRGSGRGELGGEVVVGVVHRARQHVELVVQLVEARLGDDELALAQRQLLGALARHPVPLAAALRAEDPRPAAALLLGQGPAAPAATPQFRHDETLATSRDVRATPLVGSHCGGGPVDRAAADRRARPARRVAGHDGRLAAVGSLPRRPAVGHGARGLLRRRRRLVVVPVRPRPRPGLPLGRGRSRRHQRPVRLPQLRGGAVERQGPDPQGAAVRADQRRGQPRRGRQGVLVGRSTARRRTAGCSGSTGTRRRSSRTSSCARRTPSRGRDEREYELGDTGVLDDDQFFDVDGHLRQGRARRPVHHRSPRPTTVPTPAPLHLLPQVWLRNTWAWGRDTAAGTLHQLLPPTLSVGGLAGVECEHGLLGLLLPRRRGHPGGAVLRQRDQRRRAVRGRDEPLAVHQGRRSTTGSCTGDTKAVNPANTGTKVGVLVLRSTPVGAGRDRRGAAAAVARRHRTRHVRPRVRRSCDDRQREADEFYDHVIAPDLSAEDRHVARRAYAGLLWGKQLYRYDVDQWLSRRPADSPAPSPRPAHPGARNTALEAPGARRRHLDARRVGVPLVRRLGPRLPRHPAGPRRPGVRQGTVGADVPGMVDAPERPAAGLRVGVRRRQPAGARLGGLARLPDRRLPRPGRS